MTPEATEETLCVLGPLYKEYAQKPRGGARPVRDLLGGGTSPGALIPKTDYFFFNSRTVSASLRKRRSSSACTLFLESAVLFFSIQ